MVKKQPEIPLPVSLQQIGDIVRKITNSKKVAKKKPPPPLPSKKKGKEGKT